MHTKILIFSYFSERKQEIDFSTKDKNKFNENLYLKNVELSKKTYQRLVVSFQTFNS